MEAKITEPRTRKLRSFLMKSRAGISPASRGLPATGRRRVQGLRREELAELIGVTVDWYRGFEAGRTTRVSQQFLARLADVLGLTPSDRVTLYHLALPELYAADEEVYGGALSIMEALGAHDGGRLNEPLTVSVRSAADIREAIERYGKARAEFLAGNEDVADVRPRVLASWKRSRARVPLEVSRRSALDGADLLKAAQPTIAAMKSALDPGYAVILGDAEARIIHLCGSANLMGRLEAMSLEEPRWTEANHGTNCIGTVLADRRPLQLLGSEHFDERLDDLTCTAAPIRDYRFGGIAGVLEAIGDAELVRPQLTALVTHYALEIEEALALRADEAAVYSG